MHAISHNMTILADFMPALSHKTMPKMRHTNVALNIKHGNACNFTKQWQQYCKACNVMQQSLQHYAKLPAIPHTAMPVTLHTKMHARLQQPCLRYHTKIPAILHTWLLQYHIKSLSYHMHNITQLFQCHTKQCMHYHTQESHSSLSIVLSHNNACNITQQCLQYKMCAVSRIQMHALTRQYLQYHVAKSVKAIPCLQYRKTSHISHKNGQNTTYRNVCIVTHNNAAISQTQHCLQYHTQQCMQYQRHRAHHLTPNNAYNITLQYHKILCL